MIRHAFGPVALGVMLLAVPSPGAAQTQDFIYRTNNSAITITRYAGPGGDVHIPGTINGLPVTAIGASAFWDCPSLKRVTIPSSVTRIESLAFASCTRLARVTIPKSVTHIGVEAFAWCHQLAQVQIPGPLEHLGDSAFKGCSSLATVSFAPGLRRVGNYTFIGCTNLSSVVLPETLTSIGERAFFFCSRLTVLTVPNAVTNIASDAFYPSVRLTNLTPSESVPLWESWENRHIVFSGTAAQQDALLRKLKTRKDPLLTRWLVDALDTNNLTTAATAAKMLAALRYEGPDAFGTLLCLVEMPGPIPCTEAAKALANYREPPQVHAAISALAKALTNGWLAAEFEVAAALATIATPEAEQVLRADRKRGRSADFRHAVDVILARQGNTYGVAGLIATLQRKTASEIWNEKTTSSPVRKPQGEVREAESAHGASLLMTRKLRASTAADSSKSTPPSVGMTNAPYSGTRTNPLEQAVANLSQLFAPMVDRMAGASLPYKLSAARALGDVGTTQAVEALCGALGQAEPEVRAAVAEALSAVLSRRSTSLPAPVMSRAEEGLRELQDDSAETVRRAATNSVRQLNSP